MSVEEYYEWLLYIYQRWYSNPKPVVDSVIKQLMREEGLSWEEAVLRLYGKVYREVYAPVEVKRVIGITDALGLAWNRFRRSPSLALPVLLGEAAPSLTTLSVMLIFFWVLWRLGEAGLLSHIVDSVIEGDFTVFASPSIWEVLTPALWLSFAAVLVFHSLGRAVEAAFAYTMSQEALVSGWTTVRSSWSRAVGSISRAFFTSFLFSAISYGFPGALILLYVTSNVEAIAEEGFLLTLLGMVFAAIAYVLVAELLFIYSLPSAVIGGNNAVKALIESASLFRRTFIRVLGYLALQVLISIAISLIVAVFGAFHILFGEFASIVTVLCVRPVLLTTLAAIYMSATEREFYTESLSEPSIEDVMRKLLSKGLKSLGWVFREPRWFVASVLTLSAGVVLGYFLSLGDLGRLFSALSQEEINPIFEEYSRLSIFTDIFFHNWRIVAFTTVSGVYTFLAPLSIAFLNGVVLGFVGGLVGVKKVVLGILPHGIIELPSFLAAISAGLRLSFKLLRGGLGPDELREAAYVAIGLAPFFLVAAFIEAYITPELLKMLG